MAYKYYEEKVLDDHFFFGNEIAAILAERFGIVSETDSPALKMTEAILRDMEHGSSPLYYNTKYGLRRVYPMANKLFKDLIDKNSPYLKTEVGNHVCIVGGKRYKYKVVWTEDVF